MNKTHRRFNSNIQRTKLDNVHYTVYANTESKNHKQQCYTGYANIETKIHRLECNTGSEGRCLKRQ